MLLKLGSVGEDVKKVQRKLGLKDDGSFGKLTEESVKNFQKNNNLNVDGIIGSSTWNIMFSNDLTINKLKGHIPNNVYEEIIKIKDKYNINNNLRLAHFLSQCAHESGDFKAVVENLNYSSSSLKAVFGKYFPGNLSDIYARQPEKIASRVYASRMGNGDEESKDGWKFRGRGYIQLTGFNNYKILSSYVGEDLTKNPDLVATKYPLTSAAFYFDSNKLWLKCDKGSDLDTITLVTRAVNGGTNGLKDRIDKFNKYWKLLNK